jgi:hypothetical protein
MHMAGLNHDVTIGRGNIDAAGLDCLTVFCVIDAQGSSGPQNRRKVTRFSSRNVKDYEDGCRKVRRESAKEGFQSGNSAGRCADDDNVAIVHEICRAFE